MNESPLFAREQALRAAGALRRADALVCHRHAILAGNEATIEGETGLTWHTAEPLPARAIWGHCGAIVDHVVVSERLVSLGADGALRIWRADGRCQAQVPLMGTGLVALAGGVLCVRSDGSLERRGLDGALQVTLSGVPAGRVARRGEGLIVLTGEAVVCLDAGGQETSRHPLPEGAVDRYTWRSEIRLRRDGAVLVCTSEDYPGSLYGPQHSWTVWDPATGEQVPIRDVTEAPLRLSGLCIHPMPDGHLRLQPPDLPVRPPPTHQRAVAVIGLTDRHLVSGDSRLRIADAASGAELHRTERHLDLTSLTVGEAVVTCSRYNHSAARAPTAMVWDLDAGTCRRTASAGGGYQAQISVSPDGTRLVWTDQAVLHLAWTAAPEASREVTVPWKWGRTMRWSPDGEGVHVQLKSRALCIWDLDAGTRRILTTRLLDSATLGLSSDASVVLADYSFYAFHAFRLDGTSIGGLSRGVTCGTFAAGTGGRYAIAGGLNGMIRWLDLVEGVSKVIERSGGFTGQTAADGDEAVWGADEAMGRPGCVGLVSLPDATVRWMWREGAVCAVAIGGPHVLAGERDGHLTVLSRADGAVLHRWRAHTGGCSALALRPDGSILSGGEDGLIRRWSPDGGGGEALCDEGSPISGLSIRGERVLVRCGGTRRLRQLSTWAELPLPKDMGHALLVGEGHQAVSLDTIHRLDRVDFRHGTIETRAEWGDWPAADDLSPRAEGLFFLRGGGLRKLGAWSVPGDFSRIWHSGALLLVEGASALSAFGLDGQRRWRVVLPGKLADLAVDGEQVLAAGEGYWLLLGLSDGGLVESWRTPNRWRRCALRGGRIAAGDEDGEVHLWSRGG